MVCYPKDVDLKVSESLGSDVSVDLWSQQIPADQYRERKRETENYKRKRGVNDIRH